MGLRVVEGVEQERERLRGDGRELVRVGSLEDGSKREGGSLAESPLLRADVAGDEGHDVVDDGVLHARGDEAEARAAGHGEVPHVVAFVELVLVLLGEGLEEHGHEVGKRLLDESVVDDLVVTLARVGDVILAADLLVGDGGPELDRLQRHGLLVALRRLDGQVEDGGHVRLKLLVVVLRGSHQHLKRSLPDANVRADGRLARHLHDVVPLLLAFEVTLREVHGVDQGVGRG